MIFGENPRFIIIAQEQKKNKYLFLLTADRKKKYCAGRMVPQNNFLRFLDCHARQINKLKTAEVSKRLIFFPSRHSIFLFKSKY